MLTRDIIIQIAEELFEEGYFYSEAYPVTRWEKNGWAMNLPIEAYACIDAYLNFLHRLHKYGL